MLLRAKRNDEEFYSRDNLRILSRANLDACMLELSKFGFLYSKETVYYGCGKPIWEVVSEAAMGERADQPSDSYQLTAQWQKKYEQFPVTSIRMTFSHFLTGEVKYLYVKSETPPQGDCTLVWISEKCCDDSNVYRYGTKMQDMPPMFEKLLVEHQLLLPEGVFKELDLFELWQEGIIRDDSFTSILCRYGYRPLRAGYGKPMQGEHSEQSMVWVGEYTNNKDSSFCPIYYYFFFVKHVSEEWGCNYYNGEPRCIWSETKRSFYIANSQTPLNQVSVQGHPTIVLEDIPAVAQIRNYLDYCAKLDEEVDLGTCDAEY